jgi:hypothetical protein
MPLFQDKDLNGNGVLDDGDRASLGDYLPKVTYGFNISLNYKHFDFSVAFQGVAGNKILNLNRGRFIKAQQSLNMDSKFIDHLWTGEGSTDAYPSAFALSQAWNKKPSSFFIENGAYLRVQNIQLGYNFNVGKGGAIPLRVFATADRPFIFTKYSGFTPEIGNGGYDANGHALSTPFGGGGYDANVYPISATYSLGLRATF